MNRISEKEFAKLCRGISDDREVIIKHNPLGSNEEILLWMLLCVLNAYLSLDEKEIPCFPGKPTSETYREAIAFVLRERKEDEFDEALFIKQMLAS